MNSLEQKLKNIPTNPGCYLFKDRDGDVLYVGKAKNLKKRVSTYFLKENQDEKTRQLVDKVRDINFIVTDNEVEALLLEASLIRQYQPKYNILLKSSVRYAYIKITNDEFPRLETVRKIKKGDLSASSRQVKFFGPYPFGQSRQEVIGWLTVYLN